MRDEDLARLLHRATDALPEPDVAERTWAQGRRVRRRHRAGVVVGGLATAAVVALATVQGTGGGALHPSGMTVEPGSSAGAPGERVLEPPQPPEEAVLEAPRPEQFDPDLAGVVWSDQVQAPLDPSLSYRNARSTWAMLWSACLQARGYDVTGRGTSLAVDLGGVPQGDYTRDVGTCRAELLTDSPVLLQPGDQLRIEDRSALTGRYFEYYWARQCLADAGLPTDPLVPAEDFIGQLAWAQIPAWHPYTAAAEDGRYAEARDACPLR